MKQLIIILTAATSLIMAEYAKADDLTAEEQALADKGATMERFSPKEHTRHFIVTLNRLN